MAGTTENYGLARGVATDDFIEPDHHNRLAETLDRALGWFLKKMMADGAYDGWELTETGGVSPGEGLVSGCWCQTGEAQAIETLTSNAVNYVFGGIQTGSAPEGSIRFFAELSPTKPPGAILLGSVELDAEGAVIGLDNEVPGADRNCRRLEIESTSGSGVVERVPPGSEFAFEVQHDSRFVVPGSISLTVSSASFVWHVEEAYRPDGFVVVSRNAGSYEEDFEYSWSRHGFVE